MKPEAISAPLVGIDEPPREPPEVLLALGGVEHERDQRGRLLNGTWQMGRSTQALGAIGNDVPWPNLARAQTEELHVRFLVETSSVPVFLTVRAFEDALRNDGSPSKRPIVEIDCDYQELKQTTPGDCFVGTAEDGIVVSIPDAIVDRHTRIALGIYWADPPDDASSGAPSKNWGTWLFNVAPSDHK